MSAFLRSTDLPLLRAEARDVLIAALTLRLHHDDDRSMWRGLGEQALARTVLALGEQTQAQRPTASSHTRASSSSKLAPHLTRRLCGVEGESADPR